MNKLPTAEAPIYFLQSYIEKLVDSSCKEIPYEGTEVDKSTLRTNILELVLQQRREYAKLHTKAALEAALESIPCLGSSSDIPTYEEVEKEVLNCYPENLIV